MRKIVALCILLAVQKISFGQSLNALNFNYRYNPQNEINLTLHLVKTGDQMMVLYNLRSLTTEQSKYTISWEKRESFSQRVGTALNSPDSVILQTTKDRKGILRLPLEEKLWLLVAKVTDGVTPNAWIYFQLIEKNYPVNGWMELNDQILSNNYLTRKKDYHFFGNNNKLLHVSYYKDVFPASSPPFAEKEGKVDRFLFHDSTFTLNSGTNFTPRSLGLYLFQIDTTAAEGYAFRAVHETFPKFTKIEDLAAPLLYVCTQDEFIELQAAGNDKTKFDKVVLGITKDKERAKNFMRSYFQRVELANLYFSSYKEGWKTDRGMIYLVFGLPDEVSVNSGSETWNYKTYRVRFTFVKSGSVYDPDNYVLIRDQRFMEPWYTVIDLWRKSRF